MRRPLVEQKLQWHDAGIDMNNTNSGPQNPMEKNDRRSSLEACFHSALKLPFIFASFLENEPPVEVSYS
jgi:hypothetical protein